MPSFWLFFFTFSFSICYHYCWIFICCDFFFFLVNRSEYELVTFCLRFHFNSSIDIFMVCYLSMKAIANPFAAIYIQMLCWYYYLLLLLRVENSHDKSLTNWSIDTFNHFNYWYFCWLLCVLTVCDELQSNSIIENPFGRAHYVIEFILKSKGCMCMCVCIDLKSIQFTDGIRISLFYVHVHTDTHISP